MKAGPFTGAKGVAADVSGTKARVIWVEEGEADIRVCFQRRGRGPSCLDIAI